MFNNGLITEEEKAAAAEDTAEAFLLNFINLINTAEAEEETAVKRAAAAYVTLRVTAAEAGKEAAAAEEAVTELLNIIHIYCFRSPSYMREAAAAAAAEEAAAVSVFFHSLPLLTVEAAVTISEAAAAAAAETASYSGLPGNDFYITFLETEETAVKAADSIMGLLEEAAAAGNGFRQETEAALIADIAYYTAETAAGSRRFYNDDSMII